MRRRARVVAAVSMGLSCHLAFALAVASMAVALLTGLQLGAGTAAGPAAALLDLLLVVQFPLLHSFLLSRRGDGWLCRLSPVGHGRTLRSTTYVLIGSLQLLVTFWAWTPSGIVWHAPAGGFGVLQYALFAGAWLFLVKALCDAGLGVQTGAVGWWALLRDRPVDYGGMPTTGLFACCRQPIYLGFALVLVTAPCWTPDWLLLASVWVGYCVLGPVRKERRWQRLFGEGFRAYRATVPFLLPRFRR